MSCITACCDLLCEQHCVDVCTLIYDFPRFGMNACDSWCYCSSWMPISLGPPLLTWVSLRSIGCSLALSYCYYRSNTGYCSISRQADSNWRYKWQRSNKRRYVNLLNITHIMLLRVILLSALVEAVHQSINQSINRSINQSICKMSWGPTGTQQTKSSVK